MVYLIRILYNRILLRGQLFHYIGNPDSKESGRLYRGIARRLQVGVGVVELHRRAVCLFICLFIMMAPTQIWSFRLVYIYADWVFF
jgi:hypothetical protein